MQTPTWISRRTCTVTTTYQLTYRLRTGCSVTVAADGIASAVSEWLAELGANSPLADELARTVSDGDWPAAYGIADRLSVDVVVATAMPA